jgi:hypothetical protein
MTEQEILAAHAFCFSKKKMVDPRPCSRNPQANSPKQGHLCTQTGQRSMESFKDHCLELFPVNHVFASSRRRLRYNRKDLRHSGFNHPKLTGKVTVKKYPGLFEQPK